MKTEYALRAIHAIAEENDTIKRKTISAQKDIPDAFLKNILDDLRKAGLIATFKGPGGGYRLAKNKNQITVWDVYQAVDMRECQGQQCFPGLHEECKHLNSCEIKGVWFTLNQIIHDAMSKMNLANISNLPEGASNA